MRATRRKKTSSLMKPATKSRDARGLKIAFVSTWLPTQCGIAKFTYSLNGAIAEIEEEDVKTHIVRMVVPSDTEPKEKNVLPVKKQERESYLSAADFVNRSEIDLVNVQHEYGIFGGSSGSYIIDFMRRVRKPMVTVLHTLEPEPPASRAEIFKQILQLSRRVIITTPLTPEVLRKKYGIAETGKITFIPHGVPKVDERAKQNAKGRMGLAGKYVMVSFGLISPAKGFEYAIGALPEILKRRRRDDLVYLIIGQTHPSVREREGDAYLDMLKQKARDLGVQDHVRFIERFFVSEQEFSERLSAGDIFVAPYLAKNQISSGTLVYAMAHRMCVIVTPFTHARSEMSSRTGYIVRRKNSKMIADAVVSLLDNPKRLRAMQEDASRRVRDREWPKIAEKYLEVFREVASEYSQIP